MENKLQQYQDIWYMYLPTKDVWCISDSGNDFGNRMYFDANQFHIDQCINKFRKWVYNRIDY